MLALALPGTSFSQPSKIIKRIAIDIGHSPQKAGAMSARGTAEYTYNKAVAIALMDSLKRRGNSRTFIISMDKNITLAERLTIASKANASLLISIHHDSVQEHFLKFWIYSSNRQRYSDKYSGFSLFIAEKNPHSLENRKIAELIADHLLASGFKPTLHHAEDIPGERKTILDKVRGIYKNDNLHVLKSKSFPAVLIECGVIVNRYEESSLRQINTQNKLVEAIAAAVSDFP